MDTRNKILTVEAALARTWSAPVVVTGAFDVLRGGLVRELEAIRAANGGATVVAVVLPLASGILPHSARAELAAALRMLDYVLIAETEDLGFVARLNPRKVYRLETAETGRARQLTEHVRARYNR